MQNMNVLNTTAKRIISYYNVNLIIAEYQFVIKIFLNFTLR